MRGQGILVLQEHCRLFVIIFITNGKSQQTEVGSLFLHAAELAEIDEMSS